MEELARILEKNGINAASLEILFNGKTENSYYFLALGTTAFTNWHFLRSLVEQTGCWPVLLGKEEYLDDYRELFKFKEDQPIDEILLEGLKTDPVVWLQNNFREHPVYVFDDEYLPEYGPKDHLPADTFVFSYNSFLQKPFETVLMGLVPVKESWQVPAYFRFGGWNSCPPPEVQVSLSKRWQELYGAEIVAIGSAAIEFHVSQPPHELSQALELAQEHYTYCWDTDRPEHSIEAIANALLDTKTWHFWWD